MDDPVVEVELRRRFDAGDLDGTLSLAVESYGDQLYGFLLGLARDRAQADDAFGQACERMWKGLAGFRWESSLRVWAYRVARNEFLRTLRATARARREVPVSEISSISALVARIKSTTPVHERSDVKDRFRQIRAELEPDDHILLGLRLDRRMSWTDIARVLGDEQAGTRETAALRKRFERLKLRLRSAVKAM